MSHFNEFNRRHKQSFAEQQRWLKKVLSGQTLKCEVCNQPLKTERSGDLLIVACNQGCTHVELTVG
ncbi:hypothetical protein [Celerinatantimonas diazotrophica]|uniref:Uncharacterized protein n=1 Tax=Celerinatantimonas diazotrophica TaxID=412034 RepID=A0A4V2PNJ0_9GAMM|nr:hypothetical protein [Celerinatantimonas diazotrophica]TCK47241.1 hypothetical protein EV690_2949 [Celerinatantimonas diazotrophica]CAG9296013.1 hypothetical protein CEDIAZO_01152 [Celerinatantimonas diazotrophica]